jgi:hypothetical protein
MSNRHPGPETTIEGALNQADNLIEDLKNWIEAARELHEEENEVPTPPEIVEEFLGRLEGFDPDDLEQFLFYLHKSFSKAADTIIEQSGDPAMMRAACHIELAMEAWQNRKGN